MTPFPHKLVLSLSALGLVLLSLWLPIAQCESISPPPPAN